MKIAILLLCFCASYVTSQKMSGCYVPGYVDIPSHVNPKLCTHLYYAFLTCDAQGGLSDTNGKFAQFKELKNQNAAAKLFASIGGWQNSYNFPSVAKDPVLRARFVTNCVNFCKNNDIHGIDLDWEYPTIDDKATFKTLLCDLKAALGAAGKLLSIAAPAYPSAAYDIAAVCKCIDHNNIMTYDAHDEGALSYHASMTVGKKSVSMWKTGGCPADKLVFGIPLYGRFFNLYTLAENQLGNRAKQQGERTFLQVCSGTSGWTKKVDAAEATSVVSTGYNWINYDDPASVTTKAKYAVSENLAGAFCWAAGQDDSAGTCGFGRFPLMTAMARGLGMAV